MSSAPLLDVVGCKGSRRAILRFPTRPPDGLSAPPPRWGRFFLIFDRLVSAVEQRVWNGNSLRPHHICKPAFCARGNGAGTETDLVGWFSGTSS